MNTNELQQLKKRARIAMAALDFWEYCKLKDPKFYRDDRPYLKSMCDTLQKFMETPDIQLLLMCCPPRTGKSYTLQHFAQWILGNNPDNKVMTGSYNETLSTVFAKAVRNAIMERKADEDRIVFSDVFPDVKIKEGDASMNLWSLEGHYANYLATSPTGTATGFGATCFPAGTKITTDKGDVNIEEVANNISKYKALSYNFDNKICEYQPIEAAKTSIKQKMVEITIANGNVITCTEEHLIYVKNKGWIMAKDIEETDEVVIVEEQKM